ncbi:MAG: glycoside hydrolase family 2 protein [Christensenellales bacterium]
MITRWGANIEKDKVLLEYPRPQMRRNSYINLNGMWQYAIVRGESLPDKIDGEILVPFSPECELSGVHRTVGPEDTLWYVKNFSLPADFNIGRVLLHFGAVDQIAEVYLNGIEVGSHTGGYTPFSIDITRELREENQLIVKVRDVTDTSWHTRGKQKIRKGGIWYTPQSGIWQTVWLESVPEEYISGLHILPLYDEAAVEITVYSDVERPCTARMGLVVAQGETNKPFRMSVQGFTPWSPENPHLYGFSVKMGEDMVESYFGMRKAELREDENGIKRLFLNDKPYFHNGVLDQGYWPDGLYTAPSDEAMIADIQTMKDMGFNMLRKHIKIEPLRWYYHCDRLGMLVWQDMVNGGGKYDPLTVTAPLFTGINIKDDRYARFARQSEEGRKQFRRELDDMINHLFNCVSIVLWVPFNEGWGQFDAAETAEHIRTMDPGRLIDHASGWHDQGRRRIQPPRIL